MLTWFRLTWRMHRAELMLLLAAAGVLALATLWVALQMSATRSAELACIQEANGVAGQVSHLRCEDFQSTVEILMTAGGFLSLGASAAPFVLGLVLGVPLIGGEVEGRTASIAWTLSRSRGRWLWRRLVPVVVIAGVAVFAIGLAGDALARSYPAFDGADPGFSGYGTRGPLLAIRAVAVLLIGVAVGALIGRALPAILLSAAVCLVVFIGLSIVSDRWMRAEAIPLELGPAQTGASQVYDMGYRNDVTGEIVSFKDYYQGPSGGPMDGGEVPGMTLVAYVVPGSRYMDFVLRESGVLGGLALLAGGLAFLVVNRRRPY